MTMLRRWNYEKQAYDPFEIPDAWNAKSYAADMDEIVNCAKCGRSITYGSSYTSREIRTTYGFGYAVCGECYDAERKREENHRKSQ